MRVLIADDNQINRAFVRGVLEREHFQITEAPDGRSAVDCCRQDTFDVILMDIRMPGMDGVQAARKIRSFPGFEAGEIAIIALTADLQLQQQTDLLQQGFDAVLLKPVSRVTLLDTLRQPSGASSSGDHSDAARGPIDEEAALAAAGGNRQLVDRLLSMLIEELGQFLPRIDAAIDTGDLANAREMAHKIRGSAGYTGARELQQAATELELSCARQQMAEISEALQHLRAASEELNEHFQRRSAD